MTLQLSAQAWERLADRPRKHALVGAVWDTLAELETLGGGHDLGLVAALRFVLVHHQPDGLGRCGACRRKTACHLWRRRSWPCVVWRQVHYELIGPFAGGGHHRRYHRGKRGDGGPPAATTAGAVTDRLGHAVRPREGCPW